VQILGPKDLSVRQGGDITVRRRFNEFETRSSASVQSRRLTKQSGTYSLVPSSSYLNLALIALVSGPSFQHQIFSPKTLSCCSNSLGKSDPLSFGDRSTTHRKSDASNHILAPTKAYIPPPPSTSLTSPTDDAAGESKSRCGVDRPEAAISGLRAAEEEDEPVDGREGDWSRASIAVLVGPIGMLDGSRGGGTGGTSCLGCRHDSNESMRTVPIDHQRDS
jgi:hypothetical protein